MSAPTLSVIVPATDGPSTLPVCKAAIEPGLDADDELIVVTELERAGPAAARNHGAASAAGDVLVFVDADLVASADVLGRIRERFATDAELAGLFGSYDDAPAADGLASGYRNLLHHHTHQGAAGVIESFWAGLGAVRADWFERVGGFDERRYRRPSIEDIELGARLGDAGGRVELDPGIQGKHLKRWSLSGMVRTDLGDRGGPWVELLLERRTLPDHLNLGRGNRISAALACLTVAFLALRRPRLAAAALVGLIATERSLFGLLARRLGPAGALAGVGFHLVHLLVAAASLPLGFARWLYRRAPGRSNTASA